MVFIDMTATIHDAQMFAAQRHAGQTYAGFPYTYHTGCVAEQLRQFGFHGFDYQAAAWLHDVVEDTPTTIEEIRELFGETVAKLVEAVTGIGRNRKERNACIYAKLALFWEGCVLKVCDRLANHAASICNPETGLPDMDKAWMYLQERVEFEDAVRDHIPAEMWDALQESYVELVRIVTNVLTN